MRTGLSWRRRCVWVVIGEVAEKLMIGADICREDGAGDGIADYQIGGWIQWWVLHCMLWPPRELMQ